jgi:hypothetical protein
MGQERDQQNRVTFKDVLLAKRYLGELRDTGKLSPDLQATVDQRGAEHVDSDSPHPRSQRKENRGPTELLRWHEFTRGPLRLE